MLYYYIMYYYKPSHRDKVVTLGMELQNLVVKSTSDPAVTVV